jgi:hypothetical protein
MREYTRYIAPGLLLNPYCFEITANSEGNKKNFEAVITRK